MLTQTIHDALAESLQAAGYDVEDYNPKCSDVMDIWHSDRSLGCVEITFCHAEPDYQVVCPVDYDNPKQGLVEVMNGNARSLISQLDDFFAKCKRARKAR